MSTLEVEAFYRDRSMLPPGSELTVTLADVSRMDVPAKVLASKTVPIAGGPPYRVELSYDAGQVVANMRYNLRAQISQDGKLRYTTTEHTDPFSNGAPATPVKVMLQKARIPDSSLTNTYWKAITLGGKAVTVGAREPNMRLYMDGRVSGFLGCNQFTGQYVTAPPKALRFEGIANTRKMCMDGMAQEQALSEALLATTHYEITGEKLVLFNQQNQVLLTFQAVYMN
ncbi:META domain-containing protein [Motiliproteus sp. SC1-56]|uniref:META domain-containing protein n=1 Tax=Motiliproteus sp. SC1-56 TaxID=2799565 RepID=UPI001A8F56FA|nr:META domain-containing protein [Motiliproteus sp. SC1-56]